VTRERLEQAIALAHAERPDPLRCPECQCYVVVPEYRERVRDWVAVSCHRQLDDGSWCPALVDGSRAQRRCRLDLLAALAPYVPLAHYGEFAGIGLADAELAAL
jgi:hypothetical protein